MDEGIFHVFILRVSCCFCAMQTLFQNDKLNMWYVKYIVILTDHMVFAMTNSYAFSAYQH